MVRRLQIELQCFDSMQFAQQIAELAEALTVINMWELNTDQDRLPCCLKCGRVRYELPTHCDSSNTCQRVRDVRGVYREQLGTCLDLACERAARLRLEGHEAHVVIQFDDPAATDFHAFVESSIGDQDPAHELQELHESEQCGCSAHGSEAP